MENASKALLMAAGVLMGILVLSLIVYIYATFSDSTQKNMQQLEENEIMAFNNKYLVYDGREDLTCYDILNVANMAIKDNEDDEHPQVAVLIMNGRVNPGGNTPNTLPSHWLTTAPSEYYYNKFVKEINSPQDFGSASSLIMETLPVHDTVTGETKDTRVLVKYRCVVLTNEETGRVDIVKFFRINRALSGT